MKTIVRKNEEAVSPVIATILMVAITVVLAAVLYVMVSGLISAPQTSQQLGVSVIRSGDGTNWIISMTTVPSGLGLNTTLLTLTTAAGASTNVTSAGLGTFIASAVHGVRYYTVATVNPATAVTVGDHLTILIGYFPVGTGYLFTSSGGTLAKGTLQ